MVVDGEVAVHRLRTDRPFRCANHVRRPGTQRRPLTQGEECHHHDIIYAHALLLITEPTCATVFVCTPFCLQSGGYCWNSLLSTAVPEDEGDKGKISTKICTRKTQAQTQTQTHAHTIYEHTHYKISNQENLKHRHKGGLKCARIAPTETNQIAH